MIQVITREVFVELKDLRNEEMGQFKPGQQIGLIYPMTAVNLARNEQLITNAEWIANTSPWKAFNYSGRK